MRREAGMGEKKAEEHKMRRVNELERFRVMISDLVKYSGVTAR